jgi:hypothetical protein
MAGCTERAESRYTGAEASTLATIEHEHGTRLPHSPGRTVALSLLP